MAKINVGSVSKVAETVAALQPQIAIIMTAVKGGYLAYTTVRAIFKDAGHDTEVCDGIIAECDVQIAKWQNAKF